MNERAPPQPFSAKDHIALEDAWRTLRETVGRKAASKAGIQERTSTRNSFISVPGLEAGRLRPAGSRDGASPFESQQNSPNVSGSALEAYNAKVRANYRASGVDAAPRSSWEGLRVPPGQGYEAGDGAGSASIGIRKRERPSFSHNFKPTKRRTSESAHDEAALNEGDTESGRTTPRDVNISGSPFIRAPLVPPSPLGRSLESGSGSQELHTAPHSRGANTSGVRPGLHQEDLLDDAQTETGEQPGDEDMKAKIPVGVSRLHLVELPNLKMKPIYWSPLHDISNVVRATWFYKNTMLPVETELANKLEDGYVYLKPWTDTWQDELNSCVENGADAEMKVVHKLWPKEDPKTPSRPATSQDPKATGSQTNLAEDTLDSGPNLLAMDENRAAGGSTALLEAVKPHVNSSVIYVDGKNGQILRPSLLPSASRGRRPLSAIRKGRQIGIPVVRGFSRRKWDQLHPIKPNPVDVRNYLRSAQSRNMPAAGGQPICYACAMEESRPTPTDLVLVIHGIGQKLSERMESFHFTHAINNLRRNINMELNSEPVWPHVRQDHGGIMALPVNWRSTLSLEDATLEAQAVNDPAANHFTLNDITPETIPAVRSLISDVMLDIPYYLSHHKPKMIQAVAKEANRVYRLWCINNPGFQQHGRVHLIAHSLGSAMALDVLSHQPTQIPRFDFSTTSIHTDIFEFDTKNLFLCGSPAGFFLLLNKANLLPRRGRDKPGCEGDDRLNGVAGEADTYGCLAVDNLYNIMHTTDPIAYRVNATVDKGLANSLKIASIPNASASFWQSFSSVFRWSSAPSLASTTAAAPTRPAAVTKLPSNVELETHDFTREEIAEKRMLLLNDNGQIDYFLSGGGGPLNIQYLNMLSAHSSYWTLTDFVRFIVIEIARVQGRNGTLGGFRAQKRKEWKVHKG